ncbi:MAG: beta-lactamase domain protein [Ferruginibacter sp.]|nr:beta-lactamase domain protein [Ferruginibacter sp.]
MQLMVPSTSVRHVFTNSDQLIRINEMKVIFVEMSLFITSLNSGSNGNCYYIGNDTEAVLVDAGLSCRETEKRMRLLGLQMSRVKAIFISHEHTDHIRGLAGIAGKYGIPVYITSHTSVNCNLHLKKELVCEFSPYKTVDIGALSITAFPKYHDAADPHSFIITCNHITIGVFTDIGAPCERLVKYFGQCHAAFLEANYDEELLENGRYPRFLKNRIRGGMGHLSNRQALEIFTTHRPPFMTHLLLSHLSKDNNDPQKVQQLFDDHANGTKIIVASRYEQSAVYAIQPYVVVTAQTPVINHAVVLRPMQLSLF